MPPHGREKIKILFLAANPLDSRALRLDQEAREIGEVLDRANIACEVHFAVRTRDIPHALRRFWPNFVHFSGHGEKDKGIILEDASGHAIFVQKQALARVFQIFEGVKCVVFNSCHSREQARVVAQHVPFVIGMSQKISDKAAIEFAFGFYQAVRDGEDIAKAFEYGKLAVGLTYGIADEIDVPVLYNQGEEQIGQPFMPALAAQGAGLRDLGCKLSNSSVNQDDKQGSELPWENFENSALRIIEALYPGARLEVSRAIYPDQTRGGAANYIVSIDPNWDHETCIDSQITTLQSNKTWRSISSPFRLWVEVKQRSKPNPRPEKVGTNLVRAINENVAKLIIFTNTDFTTAMQEEVERFARRLSLDYCVLDGKKLTQSLKDLDSQGKTFASSNATSQPTKKLKEPLELSLSCGFTLDPGNAGLEVNALSGEPGYPVFVAADIEVLSGPTPAPVTISASLRTPSLGELLAYETQDASSSRVTSLHIPLAKGDRRRYIFILFPSKPGALSTRDIIFKASSGATVPRINYIGESSYHIRNVRMSDWIPLSRANLIDSLEKDLQRWQASNDTVSHLLLASAGMGKSHAVARLRRCWLTRGAIEVSLDGQIHGTDLSLIKRVFDRAFPLEPRTLGEDQTEAVAAWLTRSGMTESRAGEIATVVARNAGLETADANLLADIMSTLLRRLSMMAPVVLLFEDAHKARPSALSLLREVQRRLGRARVALFVTSRYEPDSSDLTEQKRWYLGLQELLPSFTQTVLPAFQRHEAIELIQRTLQTIEEHDAEAILNQVGTSPFGIREAINYLIDYNIAVYDANPKGSSPGSAGVAVEV